MSVGVEAILKRLSADNPRFDYASEEHAKQSTIAGFPTTPGEVSWAVPGPVLRWIGEHVNPSMTTIETGAGATTVMFAACARKHYCCAYTAREVEKIKAYIDSIGVSLDSVTFLIGSSALTLPKLDLGKEIDFAYIDGCHGYPFPALDWHYIDQWLKVNGIVGMDNAELRPVREHCEFLDENGSYRRIAELYHGYFVRFYQKIRDEDREWIYQAYSLAKRDPCDRKLFTRIKRKVSPILKRYLY